MSKTLRIITRLYRGPEIRAPEHRAFLEPVSRSIQGVVWSKMDRVQTHGGLQITNGVIHITSGPINAALPPWAWYVRQIWWNPARTRAGRFENILRTFRSPTALANRPDLLVARACVAVVDVVSVIRVDARAGRRRHRRCQIERRRCRWARFRA